ncbi:cytochrome c maturation protein CcmE [Maritalea mediterranea]|uniref:Cytochrome c-type biogenesis protein CcmE n=1 Tax=Maritalea mediterranea TaxID=2909667 RepID=A0ABS9E513_9HYPH|nr:cytochrome c maturation protein CcmE [Maritalea mediterranea]
MTRKQKRLAIIGGLSAVVLTAVVFIAIAMRGTASFFVVPSEIQTQNIAINQAVRLGGIVKSDSWVKEGTSHNFLVTDCKTDIAVHYDGIVPDLFREGQEVIVEGALINNELFEATNVLAKHDENYVPKDMVDKFEEQGLCPGHTDEAYG